jgi:hypothetical protein
MKKCPYCAEEILDEAIKCKHCKEKLTSSVVIDIICNKCGETLDINKGWCTKCGSRHYSKASPHNFNISDLLNNRKFHCPSCKSSNTDCNRDIGCVVIIFIFISCGIGLIMIPFLPYRCKCSSCGYIWKS